MFRNNHANKACNEEILYFDILAQPTKFPTIFSQSNGFRLTGLKIDKSNMIEKSILEKEGNYNGEEKLNNLVKVCS